METSWGHENSFARCRHNEIIDLVITRLSHYISLSHYHPHLVSSREHQNHAIHQGQERREEPRNVNSTQNLTINPKCKLFFHKTSK